MKVRYQPSDDYEVTYTKTPGVSSTVWASGYRKQMCVDLSIEAGEILPMCSNDMRQQYAFAITVRSLSCWLERYTSPGIRQWTRDHYHELDTLVASLRNDKALDRRTISVNVAALMMEYALPVYYQAIRIISHSKILQVEVMGILDPSDQDLGRRVRGELPACPLLTREITTNSDDTEGYDTQRAIYGDPTT